MNGKEIRYDTVNGLLDAIGGVSDDLIPGLTEEKRNHSGGTVKRILIAGGICAAVMLCALLILPGVTGSGGKYASAEREMISSEIMSDGMGFEGVLAYDISELAVPNPWNDSTALNTLPVYRAPGFSDGKYAGLSESELRETADGAAAELGTEIVSTGTHIDGGMYTLTAECSDGTVITASGDGNLRVTFKDRGLPPDYHFTYADTSPEEAEAAVSFLAGEYAGLLGFDRPVGYFFADRTYSGEENRSYRVYDRTGETVRDILDFSLRDASFFPDDMGELMGVSINDALRAAEYIGDYPVITADQAERFLLDGNFFTTVPEEYLRGGKILAEDVAMTELIYRYRRGERFIQPYYRFYVVLDEKNFELAEGLKSYGVFYVPAVSPEYIADFDPELTFD